MAAAAVRHPVRSSLPLPLWAKPRAPTVAVGDVGVSCHLAGGLSASWYVGFGNYNKTHGSLGAVIAFMIWMWLSAIVILIGAEINAEHQTVQDTTDGGGRSLGSGGPR